MKKASIEVIDIAKAVKQPGRKFCGESAGRLAAFLCERENYSASLFAYISAPA